MPEPSSQRQRLEWTGIFAGTGLAHAFGAAMSLHRGHWWVALPLSLLCLVAAWSAWSAWRDLK